MSKTNDTERTRELEAKRELLDSEFDTVSGGSPNGGPAVAFNTAQQTTSILEPPLVWVGCGYVPQWW